MRDVKLRKLQGLHPGYAVEVNGQQAGEVFKLQNGMSAGFIWYVYPTGSEFPINPEFTRREAVASLVTLTQKEFDD